MTTDHPNRADTPRARRDWLLDRSPRVRDASVGGLEVAATRMGTPFVRVRGRNRLVLAHSEEYDSTTNAARAADTIEQTVIRASHRTVGDTLYEVLRVVDALTTGTADEEEGRDTWATHRQDGTGPDTHPLGFAGLDSASRWTARDLLQTLADDLDVRAATATRGELLLEDLLEVLSADGPGPVRDRLLWLAADTLLWAATLDDTQEQ